MKRISYILQVLPLLLFVNGLVALAQSTHEPWAGFYDRATLEKTYQLTPPGIISNWLEVVWPRLTVDEQKALQGLDFKFPAYDGKHPMNFSSSLLPNRSGPPDRIVTMPLSSLRFLRDICLASAYFNRKGYNEQTLSLYLSVIKCQWPAIKTQTCPYRPLDALHIPENAMDNRDVQSLWQKLFNTSLVFILCHELGHLRYAHPGYSGISDRQAQQNEKQADAFALDLMRRIGDPPFGGIMLTFFIFAHLENHGEIASRQRATHPVSSSRIRELAKHMRTHVNEYSNHQTNPSLASASFKETIKELDNLASKMEDAAILKSMDILGYSGDICQLGLQHVGKSSTVSMPGNNQLFTGHFMGQWVNERKQRMPISINLYQNGAEVSGRGFLDDKLPVELKDGFVKGDRLLFNWQMGKNYFGQGELKSTKTGLLGWWGTKDKNKIKKSGNLVLRQVSTHVSPSK